MYPLPNHAPLCWLTRDRRCLWLHISQPFTTKILDPHQCLPRGAPQYHRLADSPSTPRPTPPPRTCAHAHPDAGDAVRPLHLHRGGGHAHGAAHHLGGGRREATGRGGRRSSEAPERGQSGGGSCRGCDSAAAERTSLLDPDHAGASVHACICRRPRHSAQAHSLSTHKR